MVARCCLGSIVGVLVGATAATKFDRDANQFGDAEGSTLLQSSGVMTVDDSTSTELTPQTPQPTWERPTPRPTWERPTPQPTWSEQPTPAPTASPTPTACSRYVLAKLRADACGSSAVIDVSEWAVVVNNGVVVPGDSQNRTFNSYNPASLNIDRLVVFRARSRGGRGSGEPAHGVYRRDMECDTPVAVVLDRGTVVPEPNNLDTTFVEPPSFPRMDMWSQTVATRGVHEPVWTYFLDDDSETRAGTTGIYANPFGPLITAQSKLGDVPNFTFFSVPDEDVRFEIFPGAPSITDSATLVFKGNYLNETGVFFRELGSTPIQFPDGSLLEPAGGMSASVALATTGTLIPGSNITFGSTAPPSAAGRYAVFAGFDNESAPTLGGIYLVPLNGSFPLLTPLVEIGGAVPDEPNGTTFNRLGEAVSFDGRYVGFWGAWGTSTTNLTLHCPEHGNSDRLAYCNELYPYGFNTTVPVSQGIFIVDTVDTQTLVVTGVAKTPTSAGEAFDDFLYWGFTGRAPGLGDDTGELARWRSSAFLAVSGLLNRQKYEAAHVAFKARSGEVVNGTYQDARDTIQLGRWAQGETSTLLEVVATGDNGTTIDPEAVDPDTGSVLPVTELGIERDGFRGNSLVVTIGMGTEEAGWAGIYLTEVLDCAV